MYVCSEHCKIGCGVKPHVWKVLSTALQDFDGLIGRFSGNEVPSMLTTETGLLRVKFSADGSLQDQGFAANYLASNTPQVYIPSCTGGSKLVQVVLRTRAYGSELSWIISKRSLLNVVFAPTPTEQNIVMTGMHGGPFTAHCAWQTASC